MVKRHHWFAPTILVTYYTLAVSATSGCMVCLHVLPSKFNDDIASGKLHDKLAAAVSQELWFRSSLADHALQITVMDPDAVMAAWSVAHDLKDVHTQHLDLKRASPSPLDNVFTHDL